MRKIVRTVVSGMFLSLTSFATSEALVHPGGLNAQGCHAGSRPYHCHRAQSEMRQTADGRNRLRCDLGSRSRECQGDAVTSPAATISAEQRHILDLQQALIRHCTGLPKNFVDGVMGIQTGEALRVFQRAYGLPVDGVYGPETQAALNRPVNGLCQVGR